MLWEMMNLMMIFQSGQIITGVAISMNPSRASSRQNYNEDAANVLPI